MLLDNRVDDSHLGLFFARLVKIIDDFDDPVLIDSHILGVIGGPLSESEYFPATATYPRYWIGVVGDCGIFVASGTRTVGMSVALMDGYPSSTTFIFNPDTNRLATRFADDPRHQLQLGRAISQPKFIAMGHSMGAVLAQVIAARRANFQQNRDCKLITTGGPKAGKQVFVDACRSVQVCRWMNEEDPVPLLTPSVSQVPIIALTNHPATNRAWSEYKHLPGGLSMDLSGSVSISELPIAASIRATSSFAAWLYSLATQTASPHNIARYVARLQIRANNNPNPNPAPIPIPPVTAPAPVGLQLSRQIAAVQGPIVAVNAQVQESLPYNMPDNARFQKVKVLDRWFVTFENNIICCGPSRRRAGMLCQAGNLFLRRLLRQGFVDKDGLAQTIPFFLAAAADPNSDIKPTMKTTV